MTSKRLAYLEQLAETGKADAFASYALALEYKALGRLDDALATFRALRERESSYVPMYLLCGTMLADSGNKEEGREWLEAGVVEARSKGDSHALSELQGALAALA